MEVFLWVVLLIVGMALLIKGADLFVSGASQLAKAMHIPPLVIGLTLVSIGTSMPEFSVSLTSAIKGLNDMSFGNVIGSNIFNTFMVIGVSSMITPLILSKEMKRYDIPILIGIYGLLILFSFVISPNILSRVESIILFILMFAYIAFLILRSIKKKDEVIETNEKKRKWYINLIFLILGLAGIIIGGDLVVDNAANIAKILGMSELLVGLTIVAVGTSLPELVTSIVAAKKGENDIAIGNAIGSNIFNVIFILGLCSTITPISIASSSLVDVLVMLFSVVLLYILAFRKNEVKRWHGILLSSIYVIYLTFIILRNIGIF